MGERETEDPQCSAGIWPRLRGLSTWDWGRQCGFDKKRGDIVFNGSKEIFVLSWSFNSLIHVWPYPSDNIYLDTGIWKALFKKICDKKIKYCIYVVILWCCSLQFPVFTIHTYYLFHVIFSRVSWWTQYPCKVEVLWTIWRWLTLDRFVHCVFAYNKLNNAI